MTRVALVQLDSSDTEPVADRVERAAALVEGLSGVELAVLPELWTVGAFDLAAAREHAEPLDGPVVTRMREAARRAGIWLHAGSYPELAGDRRYNTSVVVDPDGDVVATYRKQHLFGWEDGEPSVMTAGDDLVVLPTPLGATGLATCYDLRFPELFRRLVDSGAETYLMASGWPTPRIEHWSVLTRARAIENQAWVVACNSAGRHAGVAMGGRSVVVDPRGEVVAEAGEAEEVLLADVDPDLAVQWRRSFPALTDRRL
ncbi:MAG: carbon-nitrogen family hydrolase [Frankiales bacterium]|nr:carbon-nitrogen family hydrolase [Frankiales bacterium]